MTFIERNLFVLLRARYFNSDEQMEPMTTWKKNEIQAILDNLATMPSGEVTMSSHLLNHRLRRIQEQERHAIDTSVETLKLLRIIVANNNSIVNLGIPVMGIIRLGQYLRDDNGGGKVDWIKLERWLGKLHIRQLSQLQGSVLTEFFQFTPDEIPFMHAFTPSAHSNTLKSLSMDVEELSQKIHIHQNKPGIVIHSNSRVLRRNIRTSLHYFRLAPIETLSNLGHKLVRSLSDIEE